MKNTGKAASSTAPNPGNVRVPIPSGQKVDCGKAAEGSYNKPYNGSNGS